MTKRKSTTVKAVKPAVVKPTEPVVMADTPPTRPTSISLKDALAAAYSK